MDFYGKLVGLDRQSGSVSETTEVKLTYERKGASHWEPDAAATIDFAAEIKFISGNFASVVAIPLSKIDTLIAQLKAAQERGRGISQDPQSIFEINQNCKAFSNSLLHLAIADLEARIRGDEAEIEELEAKGTRNGRPVSVKKALEVIRRCREDVNECKAKIAKHQERYAQNQE